MKPLKSKTIRLRRIFHSASTLLIILASLVDNECFALFVSPGCVAFTTPTAVPVSSSHLRYRLLATTTHVRPSNIGTDEETLTSLSDRFADETAQSLSSGSFRSICIRTDVPNIKKKKGGASAEDFRGRIRSVTGRLVAIKSKSKSGRGGRRRPPEATTVLQATYKHVLATDLCQNWEIAEVRDRLSSLLREGGAGASCVRSGELVTSMGTHELRLDGRTSLVFRPSREAPEDGAVGVAVVQPHDIPKNVPVDPSSPFLVALGVSDVEGKPKRGMKSKLRQCQKFVEIVGGMVSDVSATSDVLFRKDPGNSRPVHVVDMGCGRGYLTFALHSHLCLTYGGASSVRSTGVEMRRDLVSEVDGIARTLGGDFDSLSFVEGIIGDYDAKTGNDGTVDLAGYNAVDILIALHACDTATDDAMWYGVDKKASIIVTAPCCHKEVRRQLDPFVAGSQGRDHPLHDVLRHGIYRERIAEAATDAMRALLLEIAGYDVRVFEFIGGEHTAKNVMVAATKRRRRRSEVELKKLRGRLLELARIHGVSKMRLASLMGEPLKDHDDDVEVQSEKKLRGRMPPI